MFYPFKKIEQSGKASRWRICYQRGLTPQAFQGILIH